MPLLAGLTGAVFLTLAAQVLLGNNGMQISAVWQNAASGGALNLRAALVWWVIAGSALVAGAAIAGVLVRTPAPWSGLRAVRWTLAGLGLLVLAHVAHGLTPPEHVSPLTQWLTSLAAIVLAALMGAFGAVFALKR